jgi:hypothetical protein
LDGHAVARCDLDDAFEVAGSEGWDLFAGSCRGADLVEEPLEPKSPAWARKVSASANIRSVPASR